MSRLLITRLQQLLLILLIILLPSNLFLKFAVDTAYVRGLFIDYLLPKLYLTDLLVGGLLVSWLVEVLPSWKRTLKFPKLNWVLGLGVLLILRQFFSPNLPASVWYAAKIIEMLALAGFLISHHHLFSRPNWQKILAASLVLNSAVASWQFLTQTNFFPSYVWLGEPRFATPVGLAHVAWSGVERILPYGISAHPNILGGFLSLGLIACWWLSDRRRPGWWLIMVSLLTLVTIFFTNSVSAWLSLGIGIVILVGQRWLPQVIGPAKNFGLTLLLLIIPVSLHFGRGVFPASMSLARRDELTQAAIQIFVHTPIWGTGLNAFTVTLETIHPSQELVRFVQPAHHLFYLWLAETGLLGLVWMGMSVRWLMTTLKLQMTVLVAVGWVLLPIAGLDHYLLTQQTGLLLVAFSVLILFVLSSSTETRKTDQVPRHSAS